MTVSPNNQNYRTQFLYLLLLLSVFTVLMMPLRRASAETILTVPLAQPSQPSKPVMLKPVTETGIPEPEQRTPNKITSTSVQINTLSSIDPDAVGALSASEGGFGVAMWSGTSRRFIEQLIPRLPVHSRSGVMRDLMHRLLLSQARLPQMKAPVATIPTANPEVSADIGSETEYPQEGERLVLIRLRALDRMGDIEGVQQLLSVIPNRNNLEEISRLEVNSLLLLNETTKACVIAANEIRKHDLVYWQKVHTFCLALAGEHDKAGLNLSMMEEMGDANELFVELIYALNSDAPIEPNSTLEEPTPLLFAMFRAAGIPLPTDVIATNNVQILRAVALNPSVPMDVRLEMAERAQSMGVLSVEKLRELFLEFEFTQEELKNALTKAEEEAGPVIRALLYQAALAEKLPVASAEIVSKALMSSQEENRYFSTSRVFLPVLQKITPSSDMLWFAPEAVRALIAAGDGQGGSLWLRVLESRAARKAGLGDEMDVLLPMIRLMGHGGGNTNVGDFHDQMLSNWWRVVQDREDIHDAAVLVYSLFEGQGKLVNGQAWEELIIGNNHLEASYPDPAIWLRLQALTRQVLAAKEVSSEAGNIPVGEIVILSLMALGNDGVSQVSGPVLVDVVKALKSVGLEKEAGNLISEALLATGL